MFIDISLDRILCGRSLRPGRWLTHSFPSNGSRVGGSSDSQKMESSVRRGHTEEGAANSAWEVGAGGKEDFTDEGSFEVGFEGQVGVFQAKTVGNKQWRSERR